jgi:general transcriptional corepressor CYC8
MKRPLSPGPDNIDAKRTKVEIPVRKASPPASASSHSSRPSPVPFRTQPSSHIPRLQDLPTEESRPALAEFPLVILATTRVYHRDRGCVRPEWHRL